MAGLPVSAACSVLQSHRVTEQVSRPGWPPATADRGWQSWRWRRDSL